MNKTQGLTLVTALVVTLGLVGYITYNAGTASIKLEPQASGYADQPTLGSRNAPVRLILFENFLCEHCAAFEAEVFPQLKRDYIDTGKVEAYYVNLAWGGERAALAGLAGECIYRQDAAGFWDYKTALYEAQASWQGVDDLVSLAANVAGLDSEALRRCLKEERYAAEVQRDLELADQVGVQGTPSIVVGSEGFEAPSYSVLRTVIERQLAGN